MQISSTSSNYWLQQMQQDLQSLAAQLDPTSNTLQTLPSTGQGSQSSGTASTTSATTASAGSTTGPGLLGSDALNWLISSEQSAPSALASDIIQAVNPGGDGVSLQQVASATGQSTDALSSAFSAIDTNGDGQLSQSELTSALTNLLQQTQGDASESFGAVGGHHHHHHHGGGETQSASSTSSTTDSSSASSSTSDSTTSSSSGTGSTTTTTTTGA
jgi:hypothetical protein